MSIKLTFTTAAVVAILAGPASAGDHDLATELRDSGRYVPQAHLPEMKMPVLGGGDSGQQIPGDKWPPLATVTGPVAPVPFRLAPLATKILPRPFEGVMVTV